MMKSLMATTALLAVYTLTAQALPSQVGPTTNAEDDALPVPPRPKVAAVTNSNAVATNGAPYINNRAFQISVLNAHNRARADHKIPFLAWDNELAAAAQKWANSCKWEHSMGKVGPYGENMLAAYIPKSMKYNFPSGAVVTNSWNLDEEPLYDYNEPGFYHETGHYTQVIWKGTKKVGCAWTNVNCPVNQDSQMFYNMVCEYSPPGNVLGGKDGVQWFRENVLPRA